MSAPRDTTELRTKRAYEPAVPEDGVRILIDRLWPRGLSTDSLQIDYWAREIAPSTELRRWYQHQADRWPEFKRRYFEELDRNPEGVADCVARLEPGAVTLVYGSRERELNNASALAEYLASRVTIAQRVTWTGSV